MIRIFVLLLIAIVGLNSYIFAEPPQSNECVSGSGENDCQLEIIPLSDRDQCEIKIGQTVKFSAIGIKRDKNTGSIISEISVGKTFWNFSYKNLEKIAGSDDNIELRAISSGVSTLKAVSTIENKNFSKEITVKINP